MGLPEEVYRASYPLPMTLGHEGAGVVDKLGEGATGFQLGDPVAVYGPWGCGHCYPCSKGHENYCENAAKLGITPPGLGFAGSMAEYMIIDNARHLVPLGDLDPVQNVSLTDAGLTPYHAIKGSLERSRARFHGRRHRSRRPRPCGHPDITRHHPGHSRGPGPQ